MKALGSAKVLDFDSGTAAGRVSALLLQPPKARLLYVLAHGAGAGMRHSFLESIAQSLADVGIATFRYQFPYIELGKRRPDPPRIAQETVRSAVHAARHAVSKLPIIAGGKSFGGRMTSSAAAETPLPGVKGLVFLGFPLHAPGKPGSERAAHLEQVKLPMLFLQGTRDSLASLDFLRPVCRRLGRRATLHVVDGGDHSFKVPKQSGRTAADVLEELVQSMDEWSERAL